MFEVLIWNLKRSTGKRMFEVANCDFKFRDRRTVISLASILVDYENVAATDGLKGAEYLNEKDTLIIFYSQCCEKIRAEYIELIENSKCKFLTYKLVRAGKNALDFYIATECGFLSSCGETQLCIVSKDKGFSAVADFFGMREIPENTTVCVAPNIESALQVLTAPEDADRRRLIKEKTKPLSIDAEQARIREHRTFADNIKRVFEGTAYEAQTATILKFVEARDVKLRRQLYTGALHEFGRKDGGEIYRMLKNVI